jgi:hypothetical protein
VGVYVLRLPDRSPLIVVRAREGRVVVQAAVRVQGSRNGLELPWRLNLKNSVKPVLARASVNSRAPSSMPKLCSMRPENSSPLLESCLAALRLRRPQSTNKSSCTTIAAIAVTRTTMQALATDSQRQPAIPSIAGTCDLGDAITFN